MEARAGPHPPPVPRDLNPIPPSGYSPAHRTEKGLLCSAAGPRRSLDRKEKKTKLGLCFGEQPAPKDSTGPREFPRQPDHALLRVTSCVLSSLACVLLTYKSSRSLMPREGFPTGMSKTICFFP